MPSWLNGDGRTTPPVGLLTHASESGATRGNDNQFGVNLNPATPATDKDKDKDIKVRPWHIHEALHGLWEGIVRECTYLRSHANLTGFGCPTNLPRALHKK